jgi:hypothetical protein
MPLHDGPPIGKPRYISQKLNDLDELRRKPRYSFGTVTISAAESDFSQNMALMKPARITRHESGVAQVEGQESADLFWGLGYCHAMDRGMQMLLMRILGEGRASQYLQSSKEMLKIDLFFRRMNSKGGAPSFRMILDLGEDAAHTNMSGGPSDRHFSKWYNSDTETGSTDDIRCSNRLKEVLQFL